MRGSLDVLMTTPMSTTEIVIGKWLGTYRVVPFLAILPVLVVIVSKPFNPENWFGAGMIAWFVLVSGARGDEPGAGDGDVVFPARPGRGFDRHRVRCDRRRLDVRGHDAGLSHRAGR